MSRSSNVGVNNIFMVVGGGWWVVLFNVADVHRPKLRIMMWRLQRLRGMLALNITA